MIFDTNILIDLYNGLNLDIEPEGYPLTTVINYTEFLYGANITASAHFKENFKVLELDKEACDIFVKLKKWCKKKGRKTPDSDLFIASIAIRNNRTLLTRDRHFQNIPGLVSTIL